MTLTDQAAAYFKGIPRLAITVSILILAAWMISFVGNLLRYSRFRFFADQKAFSIHRGLISPYRYRLRRGAVNYIDIRQNLMMKLLRLMSVHISCPGYGNQKNELPVLMPLLQKSHATHFLQPLLKHQPDIIGKKKPNGSCCNDTDKTFLSADLYAFLLFWLDAAPAMRLVSVNSLCLSNSHSHVDRK